jgi:hypothetical protein
MYPHRIRLVGPWECETLNRKVTMPCRFRDCGLDDRGTAGFTRRFGYPGRIDDYERVWLTFAGVTGRADIHLNDSDLGSITDAHEFEITSLLQERNLLQVDITGSGGDPGLHGEVALEVRRTAFLRNVRVSMTDALEVSGEVVGNAEGPLEIYVVLDRMNVAYAVVEAGKQFHLTCPAVDVEDTTHPTHIVRVDLVQGASIWHREEISLPRNS